MTLSSLARLGVTLLTVTLLAGCGAEATTTPPRASSTRGGDEPLTARALAAVVADHVGPPSSAGVEQDMDEAGKGLVAAVRLRYRPSGDSDGESLSVGVGTGFEKTIGDCRSLMKGPDAVYAGCTKTADGMVFWEQQAPGEDPGAVYVMASKADTDVLFFYSGPDITSDPRRLDLPIMVQDMFDIAADPRVDVTTSPEAIRAGRHLTSWKGGGGS